jgi:putative flippase GtrA
VKLSPAPLVDYIRSPEGRKKLRYASVSVIFVPVGQALLQLLARLCGSFTVASLLSAAILTPPNFFANKLYVWKVTSKDNQRTQMAIFWVAAMLGVTFATSLTYVVDQLTVHQTDLVRGMAVIAAQLTGFGVVWVARFLLLDRWLFRITHAGREPSAAEEGELHTDVPI